VVNRLGRDQNLRGGGGLIENKKCRVEKKKYWGQGMGGSAQNFRKKYERKTPRGGKRKGEGLTFLKVV